VREKGIEQRLQANLRGSAGGAPAAG